VPPSDFVSRGQALVAAGQYQEAVKVCRLGLLGAPTLLDGRLVLAQALLALRRYDEVLAEMRVALELDGRTAAAHALKGEALLRKGDVHAAREVLLRARSMAPGDPSVAALVAETELAISSGGSKLPPQTGDAATRHYPSHRGGSEPPRPESARGPAPRVGASSSSFTRPEVAGLARGRGMPPPAERTGTVEIDPEESGIELIDDDLGEVIDPPSVGDDTSVLEMDELDVVSEDSRPARLPAGKGISRPGAEDTRAGRPQHVAKASAATVASAATIESGRAARDDNTGALDVLLGELGGPPGASAAAAAAKAAAAIPLRAPPTGSTPLVDPVPPPTTPQRTKRPSAGPPADDMQMIRAGLGLEPQTRLPPTVGKARRGDDSTGIVIEPSKQGARPPLDPSGVPAPISDSKRQERTRKVATDPGGRTIAPPRRSRWKLIVGAILAVAVIVGGVFLGFYIRALLLEKKIAAQRALATQAISPTADAARLGDAWKGWRSAAEIHAGIVKVDGSESNRAALARIRAVLAAEFGDDPDGAREAAVALADTRLLDADVARAYVALIDGDDVALAAEVATLAEDAPGSTEASYFAGRAAMLAEQWDAAIAAFDEARVADPRAASLIGLAQAHAGKGAWPEARAAIEMALAQHPIHERVIIAQARIVAAGPDAWVTEAPDLQPALERVLAESEQPLEDQERGVSKALAAWAALALAEVQVMAGDPAAARRALGRARAGGVGDRTFTVAVIHALLAVGDLVTARQEAGDAVKRWPDTIAVKIAAAEVALASGDPASVISSLGADGDLGPRPLALALRGQAHLALGRIDAATKDLDAALKLMPDLEDALVARAELELAAGNPRNAVSRLEQRYAAGASARLAVTYAAALRGVGERDRARTVLAELTGASAPAATAGRAWLETARLERDAGDARAARAAYTKAIELLADATGARLEAALLAVDAGDAEGARTSLDRLVLEAEHDGKVLVETARVHVLLGDLDGAKGLLDRAEGEPSAPRWQIARERGRLALRQRVFPVAIEALERAAGLEPSDGETRLLLIDANLGKQDLAGARRVLDDVMKRFAGLPEAQLAVGRVRLYSDALGEAREAFVKAKDQLEREHGAPRWIAEATYWLAVTTYYDGDPIKARALAVQAKNLDPGLVDAHFLIGQIDGEKLQWKAAVVSYTKVTTLDPNNLEAWFFLGEAALNAKQRKLAKKSLETYKKRAPSGDLIPEANRLLKGL